ncbi:MAG TPA: penicillin-binding transpeptidase domain-containing protein, partial [Streptosporangiaceae bacterium]
MRAAFARSHPLRLGALLVVAAVIAAGLLGGRAPDASAEPTVQSFLLDWEQGQYLHAGELTTGDPQAVALALRTSYQQLDAAAVSMSIGAISQHGNTAEAHFQASVDLGQDGAPWAYEGRFALAWTGSGWRVKWSPSVINPALRAGTRLAVRTTLPSRAMVLGAGGQPLQRMASTYLAGVRPGRLADPQATAAAFGQVTGLDTGQVRDQILAAPRDAFLGLLTLDPDSYARLRHQLAAVPGLVVRPVRRRLFDSIAPAVVGSVGTEDSTSFRQDGVAYQPGDTVGESGLQQYYQRKLVGMPTTEVVVEDAAGHQLSVLKSWQGRPGQPVRTTLSTGVQSAANRALAGTSGAAAIVAVHASTGKILAVAAQPGGGIAQPDPLAGRYPPGQAFTIVSSAALLDTGLSLTDPVPCTTASDVGGQTFTNDPATRGLGAQPLFGADFAHGCGTAFAGLSRRLSLGDLSRMADQFGLGASWRLPLPSFAGSVPEPSDDAQLAANTMGAGGIQVSPLAMAMIAAQVDSGGWHTPSLVTTAGDPPAASAVSAASAASATGKAELSDQVVGALRSLMRASVRSGAAHGANLDGPAVYGQTGQAAFG